VGEQTDLEEQVRALEEGQAYADLSAWRKVLVSGSDAVTWLNDLVTAGVDDLRDGEARRSLLLTPTGRIRADFHVLRVPQGLLLVQHPSQPHSIDRLLETYVLSSDVALEDATGSLALFAVPGAVGAPEGLPWSHLSVLGHGIDVLVPAARRDETRTALEWTLVPAAEEAVEAWRVRRGIARFPVDLGEDSVPAEAGLEPTIDFTKGCFLGQESVARVRNLGHPPRVVVALLTSGSAARGDAVLEGDREVGSVTSAAPSDGGTSLLARIRWDARDGKLRVASGDELARAD
jgi:hypothetical protein